jgi:hypothetical protein
MKFKFLKAVGVFVALSLTNVANAGLMVGTFTGGDIGEGLDFTGDFEYAVNVLGSGGGTIGDATFTNDSASGISISANYSILNWHGANYGNSANDNALEYVMQSIRWSGAGANVLTVALENLTIGNNYSLQLLFAESCCERRFDIAVEGQQLYSDFSPYTLQGSTNNTAEGAFLRYSFTAQDSILNIAFGGLSTNAIYDDNNPILNGLTLENTTSVPEPTTLAIFALGMIGLASRRFKKKS